jgi:hypothetical protein
LPCPGRRADRNQHSRGYAKAGAVEEAVLIRLLFIKQPDLQVYLANWAVCIHA